MSKIEIIEIDNFIKAIPRKRIWYKYFDDIFISVICSEGRKSHIRNKTPKEYRSIDNKMCYWHCHWQYELIEAAYGNRENGIKTYEKIIFHNGEKHIIDSVVDNVSIEFQHTLNVSIEEMDLRWYAQKSLNYLPYLVLDFTEFPTPFFFKKECKYSYDSIKHLLLTVLNEEVDIKVAKRFLKWTKSEYFKNGCLFIHFEDQIIRLNENLLFGNIKHSKDEFVVELKNLEILLEKQIKLDLIEIKKRRKAEEKAKELQELENIKKQRQKEKELRLEAEKERDEYKKRLIKNNEEKQISPNYHFYRTIINEEKIKRRLGQLDLNSANFEYDFYSEKLGNELIKYHIYYSRDLKILFIYSTKGVTEDGKYNFMSCEIQLIRRNNDEMKTFLYKQKKGEKLKILEYKSEIVIGYLHSLSNFALVKYDNNEKPILKENFIFNCRIDNFIFNDVSTAINPGLEYLIQIEGKSEPEMDEIKKHLNKIDSLQDNYFFREGILTNDGIRKYHIKSYYKDLDFEFKNHLLENFYIIDF